MADRLKGKVAVGTGAGTVDDMFQLMPTINQGCRQPIPTPITR